MMFKIKEAIVVEGRYDKNTLAQLVDTLILQTNGFQIFRDKEQLAFLEAVARRRGLIVLTDSDGAGFIIRNRIKAAIAGEYIKHAYIPDIYGKEKRKTKAGKEGKIGVEGMSQAVLMDVLRRCGATFSEEISAMEKHFTMITKADFMVWGLAGTTASHQNRLQLQERLNLPEHLSANGLLEVLNTCYSECELREIFAFFADKKEKND